MRIHGGTGGGGFVHLGRAGPLGQLRDLQELRQQRLCDPDSGGFEAFGFMWQVCISFWVFIFIGLGMLGMTRAVGTVLVVTVSRFVK